LGVNKLYYGQCETGLLIRKDETSQDLNSVLETLAGSEVWPGIEPATPSGQSGALSARKLTDSENMSFPSSPGPLYENEVKCSEMIFHSHANKTHFHKKGCALSLILKVRVF